MKTASIFFTFLLLFSTGCVEEMMDFYDKHPTKETILVRENSCTARFDAYFNGKLVYEAIVLIDGIKVGMSGSEIKILAGQHEVEVFYVENEGGEEIKRYYKGILEARAGKTYGFDITLR